jgi:hypothetical protein
MANVNDYLLEEILFNINYDEQDGMKNIHESIGRIIKSNLHWKNQYKIYMKKLFACVCFQRFDNNYENIFHLFLGILNLQKKMNKISSLKIIEIVNLQELNLFNNKLKSILNDIGNLVNLQILCLNYNQLTSLPNEIGNLMNLQELNLSNNKLTSLPAPRAANEIGNLVNRLYLHYNRLTSIPNEVGNLMN